MDGAASNFSELQGNTAHGSSTGNTIPNTTTPNQCAVREQDRFMPITNVIRIMRKVLPPHAKISDDAKMTVQECVSEFISFITSEANDRCKREQRKTITAEDVLWAMNKLGFDNYVELLTPFLQKYRTMEGYHHGSIRGEPSSMGRNTVSSVLNPYGSGAADPYGVQYHNINNQQYGIYDGLNMGNYYYATSGYGGSAAPGGDGGGGTSGTSHQSDSIDGFRSAANYK